MVGPQCSPNARPILPSFSGIKHRLCWQLEPVEDCCSRAPMWQTMHSCIGTTACIPWSRRAWPPLLRQPAPAWPRSGRAAGSRIRDPATQCSEHCEVHAIDKSDMSDRASLRMPGCMIIGGKLVEANVLGTCACGRVARKGTSAKSVPNARNRAADTTKESLHSTAV